jgi:hypothetical protein
MTTRFFRNKRNKTTKRNKKGTKKNKRTKLRAGAGSNKNKIRHVINAYKSELQDLQQQNQLLSSQIDSQNAIIQGLKGQNSIYSSVQSTGNAQIQNENANIVKVLSGISQSQQKILKLLNTELNKKSPDVNEINKLIALNKVAATATHEILTTPPSTTAATPSKSSSPATATPSKSSAAASSSISPGVAAATGVAAGVAGVAAVQAAEKNQDAANDLVNHLSNAANSIASPENIQAASDAAQKAAKATGKILTDKNVQKHAVDYGTHIVNGALVVGNLLHKGLTDKVTTSDVASATGALAKHGLNATSSAVKGLFSAVKAAKTPSQK